MENAQKKPRPQDGPVEPIRIFDDVWYIGRVMVGVFVIKTGEGLVLIDAMDPYDADEKHIIPGLEKVGLRPEDIRMILITHGHMDHYDGAKRLQQRFGCKVGLGLIDCGFMVSNVVNTGHSEYPRIDFLLKDRKEIIMGQHRFLPVLTPGHTPGGMSLIFNCHDNGEEHWVSLWVGAGLPMGVFPRGPLKGLTICTPEEQLRYTCDYIHSLGVFEQVCDARGCDVVLGVHPHRCGLFAKAEQLAKRSAGEQNPFVVGKEGVKENLRQLGEGALRQARDLLAGM